MQTETWFKIVFCVAFVYAVMIAGGTAKRAARLHGGSMNQLENEVRGLIVVRATLGIVFYAMLMMWLFRSSSPRWAAIPITTEMRTVASALLVPILLFYTWSFRSLGSNYRGGVGLYERHELITSGPYSRIRHPIYAAFIAIMLAVLVISANWVIGISGLLLVSSIAARRIPTEERELRERFGGEWPAYAKRTGSLLPTLRSH